MVFTDSEWKTLLNFIKKAMEICPEVLVVNSRCVVSTQDHGKHLSYTYGYICTTLLYIELLVSSQC